MLAHASFPRGQTGVIFLPRFHAIFGEHEAIINIETTELEKGSLPVKQLRMVQLWAAMHQEELLLNFKLLQEGNPSWQKIKPLEL